jgi:very-short-patch-repair endonuclease
LSLAVPEDLADRFQGSARNWAERLSSVGEIPAGAWLEAEVDYFSGPGVNDRLHVAALGILVASAIQSLGFDLRNLLGASESPIEAAMNLALVVDAVCSGPRQWDVVLRFPDEREVLLRGRSAIERSPRSLRIEPQAQLGDYRVDALLTLEARDAEGLLVAEKRMVIECQGHEFHERTKEQVSRDYERSRTLQSCGFLVYQFSGSDVWEDVFKHAEKALDTLNRAVWRAQC